MTLYHKLCRSSLDIRDLGFIPFHPDPSTLGTDPSGCVRFCTLEDQGDMIFAAGDRILPIAANFNDFLGLILACKNVAMICSIPEWTQLRFEREVSHQTISRKQQMILNALRNCFHPPVIDAPYSYVRNLQKGAPLDKTPQRSHPGKIIKTNASTTYGENQWSVRQLYLQDHSIDLDICIRIPGQQIVQFYDRWEGVVPDEEQAMAKNAQNPFTLHTDVSALLNGVQTDVQTLNVLHWDPLAGDLLTVNDFMKKYDLDPEQGWLFLQLRLPRNSKKKKNIRTLSLNLQSEAVTLPGPHLITPTEQNHMTILHPVTGKDYVLTVHSCAKEALDPNFLIDPPCHYTRLCYSLDPPLSEDAFRIMDVLSNDRLRTPLGESSPYPDPELENAPTEELAEKDPSLPAHIRTAFSSRHYVEPAKVEWHTRFHCKLQPDGVLSIIR